MTLLTISDIMFFMNFTRSPEARQLRQTEKVAKSKTSIILSYSEAELFRIHKGFYTHLLSEKVESVKSNFAPDLDFTTYYTKVIQYIGAKAYAMTEETRRSKQLDEVMVARAVGISLFNLIGISHANMSDNIFDRAASKIRKDAKLSGVRGLLNPLNTAGIVNKPSYSLDHEPGFLSTFDLFAVSFDAISDNREVTACGVSVLDGPGLLKVASGVATIMLLDQEKYAFDTSIVNLQDKIMPITSFQSM